MSLTKEKCKRALRELKMANDYPTSKFNDSRLIDFHLVTFEQLIEEHFDNQPLKFEELKEGDWVWDNKYKHYIKIRIVNNINSFIGYYPNFEVDPITDELYENLQGIFFFEENRFYLKEVKDKENNDE